MIPSRTMQEKLTSILCIAGPTASGKSARAVEEALTLAGEVISVDSRQVYRGLDIGTEKISGEEMRGVPHHLIDIHDPREPYSAGDFVADASRLIEEIRGRGRLPILAGGTHFYFDALLHGLPADAPADDELRAKLAGTPTEELYMRIERADPTRAAELDRANRRRLVRALEIIERHGAVPPRLRSAPLYDIQWIVIDPSRETLRARIDARLQDAFARGLIDEVRRVREAVGDAQLAELGLEYRIVGEYIRGERVESSLIPALSAKLWHFARRQRAWLRKLELSRAAPSRPGTS